MGKNKEIFNSILLCLCNPQSFLYAFFCSLTISECISNKDFDKIERFVLLIHDKTRECYDVNGCRRKLSTKKEDE